MGRKAGVTAEQTRTALLEAAARVFALKGYDGASIADITGEAGLSSGSVYTHFGGKAELFVAVVTAHAQETFTSVAGIRKPESEDEVRAMGPVVAEFVQAVGSSFAGPGPAPFDTDLLLEVIVASKRHPEVAEKVTDWLGQGEQLLAGALVAGQDAGVVDPAISTPAVARFLTMVGLGARLLGALDLPAVDQDEWAALISRFVDAARRPD